MHSSEVNTSVYLHTARSVVLRHPSLYPNSIYIAPPAVAQQMVYLAETNQLTKQAVHETSSTPQNKKGQQPQPLPKRGTKKPNMPRSGFKVEFNTRIPMMQVRSLASPRCFGSCGVVWARLLLWLIDH